MLACKVLDIKKCMNHVLASEAFDAWELAEAKITTKVSYLIDGHVTAGYLSEDEMDEEGIRHEGCIPYGSVRPLCYEMIKGKRTPQAFRFTFLCPPKQIAQIIEQEQLAIGLEDVANLTMNISFHQGELIVTTSCSLRTFSLDKTLEYAWDAWVISFFKRLEIALEKSN